MSSKAQQIAKTSRYGYIAVLVKVSKGAFGLGHIPTAVIMAQFLYETNYFTSKAFSFKNLCGMHVGNNNIYVSDSYPADGGKVAIYENYIDSVLDYLRRQKAFKLDQCKDAEEYIVKTAKSGYSTNSVYANTWRTIYKSLIA